VKETKIQEKRMKHWFNTAETLVFVWEKIIGTSSLPATTTLCVVKCYYGVEGITIFLVTEL
jgi:hypothetical protein